MTDIIEEILMSKTHNLNEIDEIFDKYKTGLCDFGVIIIDQNMRYVLRLKGDSLTEYEFFFSYDLSSLI